jgi:hypothetical protein
MEQPPAANDAEHVAPVSVLAVTVVHAPPSPKSVFAKAFQSTSMALRPLAVASKKLDPENGVAVSELDCGLDPAPLLATTVTVYVVPLVSPVISQNAVGAATVQERPPGLAVAV